MDQTLGFCTKGRLWALLASANSLNLLKTRIAGLGWTQTAFVFPSGYSGKET